MRKLELELRRLMAEGKTPVASGITEEGMAVIRFADDSEMPLPGVQWVRTSNRNVTLPLRRYLLGWSGWRGWPMKRRLLTRSTIFPTTGSATCSLTRFGP